MSPGILQTGPTIATSWKCHAYLHARIPFGMHPPLILTQEETESQLQCKWGRLAVKATEDTDADEIACLSQQRGRGVVG